MKQISDIRYQLDIAETYGIQVLDLLLEEVRTQDTVANE
jgi:hypothetical protein